MAKKRITLSIALLILLVFAAVFKKFPRQRTEGVPTPKTPSVVEEKKAPLTPEEAFIPSEIRRVNGPVSWGRDPFLSPLIKGVLEEEAPKVRALILTGIVRDEEGVQAIIGDYIVNVGDIINGKRVISIKENEVVLMKGKEKETLELEGE